MPIEAVVFDIGGVLAYDVWEHALLDEEMGIAARFGIDPDEAEATGQELWERYAYTPATAEVDWQALELDYWQQLIRRLELPADARQLIAYSDQFVRPVEHMIDLVTELHQAGIGLAICSNNNEFWFERQMARLGIRALFAPDAIVLSNWIGVSKSSPAYEMFQAVENALGIDRGNCIFIDDRWPNIVRAAEFGMPGIWFPPHSEHGASYLRVLFANLRFGEQFSLPTVT